MMPTSMLASLGGWHRGILVFVLLPLLALAVLIIDGCAGAPVIVPKTPTESLYTLQNGVTQALQTAATLQKAGIISQNDRWAVEAQTDRIDKLITTVSGLLALDPQACAWMVQAVKPIPTGQAPPPAPTAAQVTACQTAIQDLADAGQMMSQVQQGLNSKQGGAK